MKNNKMIRGLRYAKIGFERSSHSKPMGACLIKGGKIIITSNENKTAPFMKGFYPSFCGSHAEAILFGNMPPEETSGGEVYIYREKKNGNLGLARPCNFCYQILVRQNIKRVIYTTEHYPYFAVEKISDMKNLKQYDFEKFM
jgi:tRNA(Arg) A34 adenosine deaminase TadA